MPAVIGIIFDKDRRAIVWIRRRDVDIWVLPGGGVEPGETPEGALVREAQEETGYRVKVLRLAAEYTPINGLADHTSVFECMIEEGTAVIGAETREIALFPLEIYPNPCFHIHKQWVVECRGSGEVVRRRLTEVTYYKLFMYFLRHPLRVIRILLSRIGWAINN